MIKYFVKNGVLTPDQADKVISLSGSSGMSPEEAILQLGYLNETRIISYCKKVLGE